MSEKHFTHLHLHTDYSLLDGAISLEKLIAFGKANKCKALAISDHGNVFAGVKFFERCKKAGMKPILGMEAYMADDRKKRDIKNKYYHLLLLVQNQQGYKNLCKLISKSYTDGFYFKPRIDYSLLREYNEGLIATSTCLGGHIPQLLLAEQHDEALSKIRLMQEIFGDRYYLEVQPGEQEEQRIVNNHLFEIHKELSIPIFASGDCHYATKEDRYAHEVMLAVQTRHTMDDPNRMTFGECRAHMRTVDEMLEAFPENPEAIWQTGEIADRCLFEFETGKLFFPQFQLPANESNEDVYFEKQCNEGLDGLIRAGRIDKNLLPHYYERLSSECKMIIQMGFVTYLLVVSDFIQWSKKNGIAVGPGRGSVAGSLVAWALGITNIDPLKYNLLFERFLNPERISMPDIDIDFCIHGRERVIQYVKDRYGHDKVGQIITFGTMMAKGVIKDVARALGFPFEDANAITDLIPDELKISLEEAFRQQPKLQQLCEQNKKAAELFDIAVRLEGLTRHASKHAAGIVISPEPIADVLPIYIPPKTGDVVTQYAMAELESLGFLKMDFLGLKNLTLIAKVQECLLKQNIVLDIEALPLDDEKTFALLAQGATSGVFQLESDGLKDVLRRLVPCCFEDIIAVNALYRPGPLGSGMVDDFIERRHGRQKISYLFPELEVVLKETYGVIVYQEQVMKIASVIGGYSLGQADILRRAMGKKKADVMAEQKEIFVKSAAEKGFDAQKTDELFELILYFAGYGFNKSHSAAYALIAYQTAYLKANFPIEFMSHLITLEAGNPDSFLMYLQEARSMGISLLPPHINRSHADFTSDQGGIRFGLGGIKNIGEAALESIIKTRNLGGDFVDFFDLCKRLDLRVCNKRVLENLIVSGACDSLDGSRAEKIHNLDRITEAAQEHQNLSKTGQMALFEFLNSTGATSQKTSFTWASCEPWPTTYTLEREKEATGMYLSKHPLDEYEKLRISLQAHTLTDIAKNPSPHSMTIGSMVSLREVTTKKGDIMAFGVLEDAYTKAELVLFPKIYKKYKEMLKRHTLFIMSGDGSESTPQVIKIKVEHIVPLTEFSLHHNIHHLFIHDAHTIEKEKFELLKQQIKPGLTLFSLHFKEAEKMYIHKASQKIHIDQNLLNWFCENKILVSYNLH